LEDEVGVLVSKIDSYKDMIGFVSQLPAVIEILDKGEELVGSISQKIAYERYAGVLSRAFQKNNDVISIHILDLNSEVQFSFLKDPETSQYIRVTGTNPKFDPNFLIKTLQMNDKSFLMSPLLLSDENLSNGESAPHLILRIFTPIFLKKEKIGIFCSDIDIGILTRSFPEIHWVLKDGSYLFLEKRAENAFVNFSGLRDIFWADKAGIWENDQRMMAWVPFLKGKDVSLALWAGKEIALIAVKKAREKMLMEVSSFFLILLALLFLISFGLAKYTGRVSAKFLSDLRNAIFDQHKAFPGSKKRIREFTDFSENLAYILDQNIHIEKQRQQTLSELQKALDEIKTLKGIVPICSLCKKIRDDKGYWNMLEDYIEKHSDASFSHSMCPECSDKLYGNEDWYIKMKNNKASKLR
jgi:ABC-type multidrug transport system fused ATPase/permease subunit